MPTSFLTANDLRTGEIVYWTRESVWSLNPEQAVIARTDEEHRNLTLAMENPKVELEVVGPYLVSSEQTCHNVVSPEFPKKLREIHRLTGPLTPSTNSV